MKHGKHVKPQRQALSSGILLISLLEHLFNMAQRIATEYVSHSGLWTKRQPRRFPVMNTMHVIEQSSKEIPS